MARNTRIWLTCATIIASIGNGGPAVAGELHDIVRLGDMNAVIEALKNTENIDETDFFLGSPLHVAVIEQKPEIVRALIEAGADIDAPSEVNGKTALHLSAEVGDLEMVTILLDFGANVEARDFSGETAIHRATRAAHVPVVLRLIDSGAEVDSHELGKGLTPLMIASFQGNLDLVKLLVEEGADIEAVSTTGRTPFFFSTIDEAYVNASGGDIINFLADQGAVLSRQDQAGITPLAAAKQSSSEESKKVVEILSDLGVQN